MRAVARAVRSLTVFHGTVVGLVMVAALTSELAIAQDTPGVEIGTSAGVTIISAFGDSETHVGIPGGVGPLTTFSPILYATFFATPSVMVEPQISVSSTSGSGSTLTSSRSSARSAISSGRASRRPMWRPPVHSSESPAVGRP